jgi:HK97 family phage portal protein
VTVVGRLLERRQIESPSYPLTSQALVDLFTRKATAGVSVTETGALNVPAVKRAVDLIAGMCAGIPLKLYRDMAGQRDELETPTLLREPYPDVSPFVFWELAYTDLLLWGNSFHFKVRTEGGDVWSIARLLRIPPSEVTVERDEATVRNPSGKWFKVNRTAERYSPYEVMHIPAQGHDGLRGLGRVGLGAEALGVALAAEQTAAKLFGDGLQFAGILSSDQPLNQEQASGLASMFRDALAALGVGPKIPVLGRGTTFEKISMSADEGQFIQAREFQNREIANVFDLDAALLNDPNAAMNFGEAQKQNLIDFSLNQWLMRVEGVVSNHLVPRGQFFEYQRGAFLRADTQTRYQTYATAVQFGLLTRNECRALENLPPVEGGDDMLTPANLGGAANEQPEPGVSEEPGAVADVTEEGQRSRRLAVMLRQEPLTVNVPAPQVVVNVPPSEPPDVNVNVEVEPTPVNINVDPTPVTVQNDVDVDVPERDRRVVFRRDGAGRIVSAEID